MFDINAHNDQSCKEIEAALQTSVAGQKHSVQTILLRRDLSILNNEKYIDRISKLCYRLYENYE